MLAFKLSKLDAVELEQYDAIVDSMQVKNMKDIINVSYNLADILMDLPDEVFPLLSPEKVGEYMTV